jgi:TP901-1 family phage major tail protein
MTAQAGKDLLLRYHNGSSFVILGGFRSRRLRLGRETIDVTTADSANLNRVLLSGGGVLKHEISGDGIFEDNAGQAAVELACRTGATIQLQITVPTEGNYTGLFYVADLEFGGDYNDAMTFSCTFRSTGQVAFA